MKITLYNYLKWIAESDLEITTEFIAEQLMLEDMSADQIIRFYNENKYAVLENYKEKYGSGKYMGEKVYGDTTVTFNIGKKRFKITDVHGSFLHDNKSNTPSLAIENIAKLTDNLREVFNDLQLHIYEEKMNGRTVEIDGDPIAIEDIEKYMGYLEEIRKFALYV
jgi:hypothetical protein